MARFIIKIFLFISLVTISSVILRQLQPHYKGNPWLSVKMDVLDSNDSNPNTYFIGSSRIYRHLNPLVIDYFLNKRNIESSSFNLGCPAMFSPEVLRFAENFIKHSTKTNDVVVIEISSFDLIEKSLLHQPRKSYWLDFGEYMYCLNVLNNRDGMDTRKKIETSYEYTVSFLESCLSFRLPEIELNKDQLLYAKYSAANGYFPFDQELEMTDNKEIREGLKRRQTNLEKNVQQLMNRFDRNCDPIEFEQVTLIERERWSSLAELAKHRGITLVYMIPPLSMNKEPLELSTQIPNGQLLDYSCPDNYPNLYDPELMFDQGHYNSEGSRIFSEQFAKDLFQLLRDN